MPKPEFDSKKPDQESMFDFLSDDEQGRPARKKTGRRLRRKAMPTIRKPVPISKSGPLKAPKPGDPVVAPPALTVAVSTGKSPKINDNLDFLDETQIQPPKASRAKDQKPPPQAPASRAAPLNNVRPLRKPDQSDEDAEIEKEFRSLGKEKSSDEFEFDADWRDGLAGHDLPQEDSRDRLVRWGSWSAALLLLAGSGYYLYSSGQVDNLKSLSSDSVSIVDGPSSDADSSLNNAAGVAASSGERTSATVINQSEISQGEVSANDSAKADEAATVEAVQQSPIALRFQKELATVEGLVDSGNLTDAQSALRDMDRTVYGYGAVEFAAVEQRILEQQSATEQSAEAAALVAESARLEAQRIADEARAAELKRVEQSRIEAERAAAEREEVLQLERQLASERLAAQRRLEQQRLEQERAAAARLEAERLTQQRAAEEAAQKLRLEQAAERRAEEAERQAREAELVQSNDASQISSAASEESASAANRTPASTDPAAVRAEKIRLDALEEAAREEARRQIVEADRLATAQRIAEERAAAERRAARERRLLRAQEIEAERAARAAAAAEVASANVTPRSTSRDTITRQRNAVPTNSTVAPGVATPSSRPISESDRVFVFSSLCKFLKTARALTFELEMYRQAMQPVKLTEYSRFDQSRETTARDQNRRRI